MNKKLILSEFRASLAQFIVFTTLISLCLIISFIIYPYIDSNTIEKISSLSKTTKKILYLNENITIGNEYYSLTMEYLLIIGSIMASHLATKQILWDRASEYDKYLFTLPISREKIYLNKFICVIIEILSFNSIFYILSIILTNLSTYHVSMKYIIEINSAMILAQLTFASLGFLVGSLIRNPKFIFIKSDIVIIFFLLLAIPERIYDITILRYINPFSYLSVRDILVENGYKISFIIASGFIMIFSITISKSIYSEYEL